ncbi:MAG TPA: LysR substrate-binding domain-containing protein [Candidatus Competibacter sp.]|nr:LysR family transcriptional regulator [Candidatus Competibacteraceae bacterium]HPE71446.1 LysR substrate-binding domain-containing protein [Candidatus Competibacter sp.]
MTLQLDPDLLRTFVAIVDAGGFTSAAQQVHRTQSAVSMQVRRLETTLERTLFQRAGRGVQLTPDGEALLGYARRLLKLHDEALAVLTRPELTGFIRLGTPDDYVERFLPDILVRFARAFPRVQVEVHCEPSVHLRRCLAEDRLDLALITCAPGAETGEVLRREPTVWATAERHLAHEQDPLPLALFQPGCPFRDWALAGLGETGRPYRVAYTSASITGLFAAVTAGLAVTVLGHSLLPETVRALRVDEGFPPLPPASITLQRGRAVSAVGECLAGYLREGFALDARPVLRDPVGWMAVA